MWTLLTIFQHSPDLQVFSIGLLVNKKHYLPQVFKNTNVFSSVGGQHES